MRSMLTAGRCLVLATLLLARFAEAQIGELMVIQETGPRDKRVNMVFIGDGYTAAEKSTFLEHARLFSKGVVEDLPLTGYAKYFNVYAIFVPSAQSGADIPTLRLERDTYFDARYDSTLGRLLVIDFAKGFSVIDKLVPERDIPVAIVNSNQYGGSGGPIAVANFGAPEIIAHEVQHSFSGLGDEYDYAGVDPWEAPNTTRKTDRKEIPWTHWISDDTPVPTPETPAYASLMGLFEGAAYNAKGWYRPKQNCRMRENGRPFCSACSEAILLQVYDRVSPLDSALPAAGVLNAPAAPITLRVVTKQPTTHDIKVEWVVDGTVNPTLTGTVFNQALAGGRHRVTARISDPSPLVRKDPYKVLQDSASWEVVVGPASLSGDAGRDAISLDLSRASRGRLSFRLPRDGAFRLSVHAADGRRMWWKDLPDGRRGTNTLRLADKVGNGAWAAPRGLAIFRLEQDGRRAEGRALLIE